MGNTHPERSGDSATEITPPAAAGEWVERKPDLVGGAGKGATVGSVIPTLGAIIPAAVGVDIGCGMIAVRTQYTLKDLPRDRKPLREAIERAVPLSAGHNNRKVTSTAEPRIAELHRRAEKAGFNPAQYVAKWELQLGSLGSGNHFIEVEVVDEIFDEDAARVMGLHMGCLTLLIHCGSRGFGHQICTDYVRDFQSAVQRYNIELPDRELVCAPMDSAEGKSYLGAMNCAANFAFANRQLLAHQARQAFEEALAGRVKNWHLHQVYDIAHNMGKIETHEVDGRQVKVCVHRKGATRAFGPGSPGLPPEYKKIGQPVIIPGSMGTASWVLIGTEDSMTRSFGSSCHGAGRVMSRSKAKKEVRGDSLRRELENRGIKVRAGSLPGLAEEAPSAYKDVDMVVETVSDAGIAKKVARLRPVAVIKG